MTTTARNLGLLIGALALLLAAPVWAQPETYEEGPNEIYGFSGVGIFAGGGVADFSDSAMRDVTDIGGAWDVRATLNTRSMLGLELGYTGTVQDITALGLDTDAVLLGTMVEANARINVLPRARFVPYVIGGAGYARYDLANSDFNTSSVNSDDQMLSVPVGAGIGFRAGDTLIDLRGTYRFMFGDDLVSNPAGASGDAAEQDNWSATARLGFEF